MVGKTLNHYRIVAHIGSGGMGEVFSAEDTRLKRLVALKVLPQEMAAQPDRRARFEREAQAVAALHHPHIVTVHSVEEAEGLHFITMELVEGKRLTDLIPSEGMTVGRMLEFAIPLCDALSAAHQRGIAHRDLKPDNVMIGADGRLKVLDFGLAKLTDPLGSSSHHEDTVAAGSQGTLTQEGQILGTVRYMAPEQAEGRPADARSDVFAIGILLYEMISGRHPFRGDTPASTLAAILRDEPRSLADLKVVPPDLARIIRRCLHKQADRRYQGAIEARNELEDLKASLDSIALRGAPADMVAPAPRRRLLPVAAIVATAVAIVATAAAIVATVVASRRPAAPSAPPALAPQSEALSLVRLSSQAGVERSPTLTPDGKTFAYAGDGRGNIDVYSQRVGGEKPVNLTEGCAEYDGEPSFSPDGEQLAYRSECNGGGLFVMGATGESARRVLDRGYDPTWSPDGKRLAFATARVQSHWDRPAMSELWTVDVATGSASRLFAGDAVQPSWSPHGHRIAYWGLPKGQGRRDIWTLAADGGEPVPVTSDAPVDWSPEWSADGRYLYFSSDRGGTMDVWRVPIDERSGKTLGAPVPVTTGGSAERAGGHASADGRRFVYTETSTRSNIHKVAFDARAGVPVGAPTAVTSGAQYAVHVDVSPDGQWLVFETGAWQQEDIFVVGTDGAGMRRLTSDLYKDRGPRWAPDGNRIAFYSNREALYQAFTVHADGSGLAQVTRFPEGGVIFPEWSRDGAEMLFGTIDDRLFTIGLERSGAPRELPPFGDSETGRLFLARFSPDGRWLACVRARPAGTLGGLVLFSPKTQKYEPLLEFGDQPAWLGDSRRLLFVHEGAVHLLDRLTRSHRVVLAPPRGAAIFQATVSPDDRALYFTQVETEADIWMLERR